MPKIKLLKTPKKIFFEGLQNGDTITLRKVIHKNLTMQTISLNKEGKSTLNTETTADFLKAIATKKKEDIWFEKLLSYIINVDENLAIVWTPYEFYFNEIFRRCGVNAFQLFFNGEQWKIISIIDTRRKDNCVTLDRLIS